MSNQLKSTCTKHFCFKDNLSYEAHEWLERYGPSNRVWHSALMVCWDSKTVMGLMCSSEGGRGKRDGGGNGDQEGNWTWVSWWVWVKRHATLALRKRVYRTGLLWSVTCPAYGFMYLFSLPAPVGFQPNGEPQWGGYSNTLKSFYRGPYTRVLLRHMYELELHGPVLLSRGPFTFVFQLTTVQSYGGWAVCWWSMQNVKLMHVNGPIMISWLQCYYCSLVSILLLLCFIFFFDAGNILLAL